MYLFLAFIIVVVMVPVLVTYSILFPTLSLSRSCYKIGPKLIPILLEFWSRSWSRYRPQWKIVVLSHSVSGIHLVFLFEICTVSHLCILKIYFRGATVAVVGTLTFTCKYSPTFVPAFVTALFFITNLVTNIAKVNPPVWLSGKTRFSPS